MIRDWHIMIQLKILVTYSDPISQYNFYDMVESFYGKVSDQSDRKMAEKIISQSVEFMQQVATNR